MEHIQLKLCFNASYPFGDATHSHSCDLVVLGVSPGVSNLTPNLYKLLFRNIVVSDEDRLFPTRVYREEARIGPPFVHPVRWFVAAD